jgi:Asp-tRNA(Asn)/Glu-tRNA(Gln) amidotransferase A subunit family amidase
VPSADSFLSVSDAARMIAAREVSSEELVCACLDRIAAREDAVHAWAHLDADGALAQAHERDGEQPRGLLHGISVGVKDIIDVAGLPAERGSAIYRGRRPSRDAVSVSRLRAAGGVILGKTVTTEFATWMPARTVNPHDSERTPGGSSSGSAAAVADGMVQLALGTQTVGSTIRPASFCGVCGFKPTHGALSLEGTFMLSSRLDTMGLFARDVPGLRALARALGLALSPDEAVRDDGPPSIALVRTPWWDRADDDGRRALLDAANRLAAAGARVDELELPAGFSGVPAAHMKVTEHDVARALSDEYERHRPLLSEGLAELVGRGLEVSEADCEAAFGLARRLRAQLDFLFEEHDALLTPAVVGEAPVGLGATGDAIFCQPWSLLGTPALTLPAAVGDHAMPIGVQLVGACGEDQRVLAVGDWAAARLPLPPRPTAGQRNPRSPHPAAPSSTT